MSYPDFNMDITNPVKEEFEHMIQQLEDFVGSSPELEKAKDEGPMEWEEAMSKPLILPIRLENGGKIEMVINGATKECCHGMLKL